MSNTSIQLKKSGVTGNTPSGLAFGEVALNYADGKLYYKNSLGGTSYISNQFSFDTINSNNSLILAGGVSDTLSFVAGDNITISTNTTTKTITINATSGGDPSYAFDKANSAYNKANNALANTSGTTFDGEFLIGSGGKLTVLAVGGDEGGEILLGKAVSNTTLSGTGVTIDVWQNRLRFFEQGGSARGAYIDLTAASAGVGSDLLSGGGGTTDTTARASAAAAFEAANSAGLYANAAFIAANSAYGSQNTTGTYANVAFSFANSAGSYANSAYLQANTATNNAAGASLYANGAFIQANAAFANSNVAYTHAEAAFAKANTGTTALDVNSEIIAFTIAFS
jgi:hypothetical protein